MRALIIYLSHPSSPRGKGCPRPRGVSRGGCGKLWHEDCMVEGRGWADARSVPGLRKSGAGLAVTFRYILLQEIGCGFSWGRDNDGTGPVTLAGDGRKA